MSRNVKPVSGGVYTMRQIEEILDLQDGPHYGFAIGDHRQCIQNGHLTSEELLAVPGIADTKWRYRYTTHEWVPVFELHEPLSSEFVAKFVDVCPDYDALGISVDEGAMWVTPKGAARPMFNEPEERWLKRLAEAHATWSPEHFALQQRINAREEAARVAYERERAQREAEREAMLQASRNS